MPKARCEKCTKAFIWIAEDGLVAPFCNPVDSRPPSASAGHSARGLGSPRVAARSLGSGRVVVDYTLLITVGGYFTRFTGMAAACGETRAVGNACREGPVTGLPHRDCRLKPVLRKRRAMTS